MMVVLVEEFNDTMCGRRRDHCKHLRLTHQQLDSRAFTLPGGQLRRAAWEGSTPAEPILQQRAQHGEFRLTFYLSRKAGRQEAPDKSDLMTNAIHTVIATAT